MPRYSIIIPVYNRPDELKELLDSLTKQSYKDFEVIIIEDGSKYLCVEEVRLFEEVLDISYYFKENTGQGFSRNFGFEKASGDYFIVFDSDCIIPANYLEKVEEGINRLDLDAFGGPDMAHECFSPVQKAISYAMTSVLTTGGIRGRKKRVGAFHPRSFNMGISRKVWEATGGYLITRMGEDIEFSIRIMKKGFRVGLISEAFVYHKRRTSFKQFFKQLHFFGRARVNIYRFFPDELKLLHFFPALFTITLLLMPILLFLSGVAFNFVLAGVLIYLLLVLIDAIYQTGNFKVAILGVFAVFVMLTGYGIGFLKEMKRELLRKN